MFSRVWFPLVLTIFLTDKHNENLIIITANHMPIIFSFLNSEEELRCRQKVYRFLGQILTN